MSYFDEFKVNVPEGTSGKWSVEHFTVTKAGSEFDRVRAFVAGSDRYVPEGTYTKLMRGGSIIMSDTPDEIRDHIGAIQRASGRCLVAGLGLGMVASAMLQKPEVDHVTIIEVSPDVIALVGPWLTERFPGRVTIIEADILSWEPPKGEKWSAAWFDIWEEICGDNIDDMKKLHRRFARRATWKGSWARAQVERANREWARSPWNQSNRSYR